MKELSEYTHEELFAELSGREGITFVGVIAAPHDEQGVTYHFGVSRISDPREMLFAAWYVGATVQEKIEKAMGIGQ